MDDKAESMIRMDEFASILNKYSTKLADKEHALHETEARKKNLQNILERKIQVTAKLRGQADVHRVQEQVRKEREHGVLQEIEQLNKDLQASKEQLEETRLRSEQLRRLRQEEVSRVEATMNEVSLEFTSLQLVEKGEAVDREGVSKELSQLEEEVAALEDQHNSLTEDNTKHSDTFNLDALLSLLNEAEEFLETLKNRSTKLRDEEATLKKQLEALPQKDKHHHQHQDSPSTQQQQ